MIGIEFIPISVATLTPTDSVGLDLYQKESNSNRLALYRSSRFPLSGDDIHRLQGRGVRHLFINENSRGQYQQYLRSITSSAQQKAVPFSVRIGAMAEVVRDVMETSFESQSLDSVIGASKKLGEMAADLILDERFVPKNLFDVLHDDHSIVTHSTNVAFYCGVLAANLGCSDAEVQQIISGGLIHDLGKVSIDEQVLHCPGKLEELEMNKVKTHPTIGFRRVADRSDLSTGQLMMIYQHHEKVDGTGYPVFCVKDEIHRWAQICAVTDVYEALTSCRPYREPMSRSRAINLMQRDSGTHFDPEILKCWTKIIHQNSQK